MPVSSSRTRVSDARDIKMIRRALALAEAASQVGEVPVGALVVFEDRIISQAYNLRETLKDPTAHAERLALTLAGRALGRWRLTGCTLYVTLEPCLMCAGAIWTSRIDRLVYGVADEKAGACRSRYRLCDDPRMNHQTEIKAPVLPDDCAEVLKTFFEERRPLPKNRPRRGD